MNIEINYNTVSFESQINCNDVTIQSNLEQTVEDIQNKRITDWFETFINRVKEESNNDSFSIEINGCDLYEKVFIETVLEKEGSIIHKKMINFVKDESVINKYNAIDSFFQYTLNSKEDIVKEAIKPNVNNISTLRSNKIEVPVIATMSSGKSTLLNALIGQDFLFEDTGTATSTTCTIKVNNNLTNFIAKAFDEEKKLKETDKDVSDFLKCWNLIANHENQSKLRLSIEGPVKDLNSSNFELHFIDTPGPNSAKYEKHKDNLFLYLKDNQKLPIVLYVLDPEKMDSKDDDETLEEIRNTLNDNQQNLDRIIFIYNKVDREDLEKKSLESILLKVTNFLKNFGIVNPKIFPVSAQYAKLAQLSNTLTRKEKIELITYRETISPFYKDEDEYRGYQLLEHSPLPNHLKEHLKNKITINQLNADLVYSGLAAIKLYIEDYIINHHQKNLYKDLMDIAYNVYEVIETKIKLEQQGLEERTTEEQKKNRERTHKEKEALDRRKTEALLAISQIEPNKKFILGTTRRIEQKFELLQDKIGRRNDLNKDEAKRLIDEANTTISNLRVSIETDLISKMNDELVDYLLTLKKEVVNKFELKSPTLETKAFNAELLNNINVLDINSFADYERTDVLYEERDVEREVPSTFFLKRIFGFKDTIIVTEHYEVKTTVIQGTMLFNDVIEPISKQFNELVHDFRSEFERIINGYNNSFKNLVKFSFNEAINSVFQDSQQKLALSIKDKENQSKKLNDIVKSISKFKIQEYNEKIYRKPAIA